MPWPLGFPLGAACNPALQRRVLLALLGLLSRDDVPVLENLGDVTVCNEAGP